MTRWETLRTSLAGEVVLPADDRYATARQLQIAEFDAVRPAAVAYCETAADVRTCLLFGQANGLPVIARSGGHHFAGWSTGSGLVVDLSRLNSVGVLADTVHIGPGAQAVDVLLELAAHDRQIISGLCPTVCPAGFISGGGIGWQTRTHGVASDRLVSAEVVLADGRLVRCSADEEPDLFWALRGGGGGQFGVVVDLEVLPIRVPRLVNFTIVWDWEHALDVLANWQRWLADGPLELASEAGVLLPDAAAEAVPTVMAFGAFAGSRERFDAALAELSQAIGSPPLLVEAEELPYAEAMVKFYRCESLTPAQRRRTGTTPEAQLPRQGWLRERHRVFSAPLTRDLLGQCLEMLDRDRLPGQMRYFALLALGGAANEIGPTETAYVHRDAQFVAKFMAVSQQPRYAAADAAAGERWSARGFALIDPHSNGHSYVNYADPELTDWKWSYYGENYERLVEVKKTYDPTAVFEHPQSIGS